MLRKPLAVCPPPWRARIFSGPCGPIWLSEHPTSLTVSPLGVLGHVSMSLLTPSLSSSFCDSEQPKASTCSPAGVPGHASTSSENPSESVSFWASAHPSPSTLAPVEVFGHKSTELTTPSPSSSVSESEHPVEYTGSPAGVSGHASTSSRTPSWSLSPIGSGGNGKSTEMLCSDSSNIPQFATRIPFVLCSSVLMVSV